MVNQTKIINMYFASSKTCNLNCRYCYVPKGYKQNLRDDQNILNQLVHFIKKAEREGYQIGAFAFHGAEPALMSPEILAESAKLVNNHRKKIGSNKKGIAIQSNGTLWNRKYLERLQTALSDIKDVKLGFSIDPPESVHNELRDQSFNKVDANFELAIEMGFQVSVLSVFSQKTWLVRDGFSEWMKKQIARGTKTGNPYRIKCKLATGELGLSVNLIKPFGEFLIQNELLSLIQILTPGYCIQDGNDCLWFEFDLDGNCYSCNKQFKEDGIFGSWIHNTFDEIFKKREGLFQQVPTHIECNQCPYQMFCNSGCPSDRFFEGVMKGKAHECELIKTVCKYLDSEKIPIAEFLNMQAILG